MEKSMFGEIKISEIKKVSFKDGTIYTIRNKKIYRHNQYWNKYSTSRYQVLDRGKRVRCLLPDEILLGACLIKHKGEEKLLIFD